MDTDEQRAAQLDPWVMYLVVRSDLDRTPAEVLLAAAEATARVVDELSDTDAHRAAFSEWSARSFRKVSVRAKGKQWERLLREHCACSPSAAALGFAREEPLVCALVPRKRSANDAFLRGLQVYNPTDLGPVEPTLTHEIKIDDDARDAMVFALNPAVAMSLGKSVAQVGHAVLMCATSAFARERPALVERWAERGYPCEILPREPAVWQRAKSAPGSITVRDAGLTEVTPGSETVRAAFRSQWPRE
ncbi:MAG: aminoacyl-tRNA hydrolase [Polyangiales bacterium]